MNLAATSLELRRHPRARLRLPARIRWRGPLGMRFEIASTLDVARDGIRVQRLDACEPGSRAWVVFPFNAVSAEGVPPETPARVVRVAAVRGGGYQVALQLELPPRDGARPADRERRTCARISFALPIFVRALGFPWPEESMTQNISRAGARFESAHIYSAGDPILAKIPWGEWERAGEIPARIVRVESCSSLAGPAPLANPAVSMSAILSSVAFRWNSPAKV
ncbi:MAG: PilZ domain-containing protein [Candidatus Acidiferrales bacterium]